MAPLVAWSDVLSDFPPGITEEVGHRPWPIPDRAWVMTQSWHDVLFAHWPVSADALCARIPSGLELDLFNGRAWISIVPFHMTNVAPRGVPQLPLLSAFPELNVRTYVRVGDRPGVYFFSLDAGSQVAVWVARILFNLPYHPAFIDVVMKDGWIEYTSQRMRRGGAHADFSTRYRPAGPVAAATPGSLDFFLTERYCLYTVNEKLRLRRLEIHHAPWRLQAAEATIAVNSMAEAAGIALPAIQPLLQFAKRQDTVAWPPADVSEY